MLTPAALSVPLANTHDLSIQIVAGFALLMGPVGAANCFLIVHNYLLRRKNLEPDAKRADTLKMWSLLAGVFLLVLTLSVKGTVTPP